MKLKTVNEKRLLIIIIAIITLSSEVIGQKYSDNSLKIGIGLGINEGLKETGMGALVSFGYQRSIFNDRVRINPNFVTGGFYPFGITDTRDQYYRVTSVGINGYLDAIKFKSVSLFIGAGGQINYSRGLLGTGGWPEEGNTSSEYFFKLYYGGYLTGGIRVSSPDHKIAYEFSPFNICFGNDNFFIAFFKFGIDIKLNKKK
jgi:hypothetical protein